MSLHLLRLCQTKPRVWINRAYIMHSISFHHRALPSTSKSLSIQTAGWKQQNNYAFSCINKFRLVELQKLLSHWSLLRCTVIDKFQNILLARKAADPKSSRPVRQVKEDGAKIGKEGDELKDENDEERTWKSKKKLSKGKQSKNEKLEEESETKRSKKRKNEQEKNMKDLEEKFGKDFAEVFKEFDKAIKKGNKLHIFALPIALIIFIFALFWTIFQSASDKIHPQTGQFGMPISITWNYFLQNVVTSGAINKIIITYFPSKNIRNSKKIGKFSTITVYMNLGAKDVNGTFLAKIYHVDVPDVYKVEQNIRQTEMASGIPPERWANIQWNDFNKRAIWLHVAFLLSVLAALVSPFLIFSRISKKGFNPFSSMFSSSKIRVLDTTTKEGKKALKIKFRDVAGLHEAKIEISEFVDYLRKPQKYTKLGAKLPKGALLTGPPGCGKTLLAKALAAESSVPFININGTEFVEMIGGLGASRVRDLFKLAKSRAPCIIYIDEIEAIGRKRQDQSHGHGEIREEEQTLNQLLVEMDGVVGWREGPRINLYMAGVIGQFQAFLFEYNFRQNNSIFDTTRSVVVIGSTNRPDILDKALLRPGRFDRHVTIDLPTLLERKETFDLYLQKIKKENSLTGISHRLAQMTPGFSGADIANVLNEAAIHAATDQKKMVKMEDIDYAMEKIIAGPQKRSRVLVQEEREIVAFHESGHALVGWLLEHTEALLKVTIIPRTSAALGFAQYSPRDRKIFSKEELIDRMCMMLGGRAAENVVFGRITTGATNDLEKVTKNAQAMVKWYGMNDMVGPISFIPGDGADARSSEFMEKPYSKKLGAVIDQEVNKMVADAYYFTEKLVKQNCNKLNKLAKALLERETLNYEDIKRLIGPPRYGDKNVVDFAEEVLPDPMKPDYAS